MSWFRVHRGWMNSHDFAKEPFTEREAWLWIVENAAYEPHKRYVSGHGIELGRGQLLASQRVLSDEWKWGRQRVRGFIAKLEHVGSITQNSTHGLTMITVCNYERYQGEQPTYQPSSNPAATQQQPIKEEGKEIKKGKNTRPDAGEYAEIFQRWNTVADKNGLARIKALTDDRKKKIHARILETSREDLILAVEAVGRSSFCKGFSSNGWKADFDFVLQPKSFMKLLEGAYEDHSPRRSSGHDRGSTGDPEMPAFA